MTLGSSSPQITHAVETVRFLLCLWTVLRYVSLSINLISSCLINLKKFRFFLSLFNPIERIKIRFEMMLIPLSIDDYHVPELPEFGIIPGFDCLIYGREVFPDLRTVFKVPRYDGDIPFIAVIERHRRLNAIARRNPPISARFCKV